MIFLILRLFVLVELPFTFTNGSKDSIAFFGGNLFQQLPETKFPDSRLVLNKLNDNFHLKGDKPDEAIILSEESSRPWPGIPLETIQSLPLSH